MELEKFKKILSLHREVDESIDDSNKILKFDISESLIVSSFYEIFDIVFKNEYDEQGRDWINWYVFEKSVGLNAYKDGKVFLENEEELWEYVEENFKVKKGL